MADYLKKVLSQIFDFIGGLSASRKLALFATSGVVVAGIAALFIWAGDKTFVLLMGNLSSEDAANISRVIGEKKIPFRMDSTGKNISVPPENLDSLRLELATLGLPQSGAVGYEVFDKQSLGTTSFVQKINQKRALEGELMRTIGTIKGVKRSRVHLAIPQKSTFVEDQKKATASVVLDLLPGTQLSEKQIFGMQNLVSRAVEGMDVSDVVIVDSQGKTLSKNSSDPLAAATATQLDFRQKFEGELEKRIEAMLSRVVGEGKVVARVSADLDFSQVNETQTIFDADGSAVRSVSKNTETMQGSRPGPQGPAGATSNLPGQPPAPTQGTRTDTNHNNEVTNYEVPQTVRKTMRPSGGIKRLSVAVMVDGKPVRTVGADGVAKIETQAWSVEKMAELEAIVSSAVGIDKKRGDILEIKGMEFTHEDLEEASRLIAETERKGYIQNIILYGVVGLTIMLFFLFVVRPFIKWVTENTIDSVETYLPQTIEELERLNKNSSLPGLEEAMPMISDKIDPEKVEGEMIKEKIITLIEANPHKASLILRDWLHGQERKKTDEKAAGAGAAGGKGKSA